MNLQPFSGKKSEALKMPISYEVTPAPQSYVGNKWLHFPHRRLARSSLNSEAEYEGIYDMKIYDDSALSTRAKILLVPIIDLCDLTFSRRR